MYDLSMIVSVDICSCKSFARMYIKFAYDQRQYERHLIDPVSNFVYYVYFLEKREI